MQNLYSDDRLLLAARLYYVDGLGQKEVAKFTNVSQAKVSRLLAMARARGIVRITVADYDPRRRERERQLLDQLGLEEAVVIKTLDRLESADLRRALGRFAAAPVSELIRPRDVVAVAGGRTICELVHHLPEAGNKTVVVVQAMGSVDSTLSVFDAQEVGRIMAQRLGGEFLAFNTPAYIPDKRTRDMLLKLEQVRDVQRHLDRARVAFVGVGSLENSVFIERGVLKAEGIRELQRAGAVGEVCGRFFDAQGRECDTPWRDRVMSVQIEQLRQIPQVIGVVAGSDRSEALLAAIRGKILKALVIDEAGAEALLAAASESLRPRAKRKGA